MTWEVEYTLNAQRELEEAYAWIQERAPMAADRWRENLITKVEALAVDPLRNRLAPESKKFPCDIRQILFRKRRGQYRILYTVEGRRVVILSVRHSFRHPLEESDLPL